MQIRRMDVEMEIDFAICHLVAEKDRRLVVPDLYNTIMEIIINAMNDISEEEIPERIYEQFKLKSGQYQLWDLIGEYTVTLASSIRAHFISEGHGREFMYKFVRSPLAVSMARDQIVVDLELTAHHLNPRVDEEEDILEVIDEDPSIETLNRFYDEQERELQSFRKYKTRL